jgi:hypothetical protein
LAVGSWQLAVGSWQKSLKRFFAFNCKLPTDDCQLNLRYPQPIHNLAHKYHDST